MEVISKDYERLYFSKSLLNFVLNVCGCSLILFYFHQTCGWFLRNETVFIGNDLNVGFRMGGFGENRALCASIKGNLRRYH